MVKSSDKKDAKKGKKKLRVDFTGVDVRILVPEGDYHASVAETALEDGSAAQYIAWKFKIHDDDKKINGQHVYYNTSLAPQALWNLRNLLEALGVETPSSEMDLDLESYAGLELMIRVEHESYEGKDRARVSDFSALEETADAEDDEKRDEEETDAEEEVEEAGEDEEEAEAEPDEEEEEEASDKLTGDEVRAMDEAELKDLIKKHKLKVDIKGLEKKPKKRAAMVIDALEKADLLGED